MVVDLEAHKGDMPYASETFGIYRPLLGWRARMATARVNREGQRLLSSLVAKTLKQSVINTSDGANTPVVRPDDVLLSPRLPFWMESQVGKRVQADFLKYMKENGKNAEPQEIKKQLSAITSRESLKDKIPTFVSDTEKFKRVKELGLVLYSKKEGEKMEGDKDRNEPSAAARIPGTDYLIARESDVIDPHIEQREHVVAGMLNYLGQNNPAQLQSLLSSNDNSVLNLMESTDPLANFDKETVRAVLSPIGLLFIYRQYFFELDPILGPSVEHIWLSPGGMIETFEVHSRRTVTEREVESAIDVTTKEELSTTIQDELSDSVKNENQREESFGVSAEASVNYGVFGASAETEYNFTQAHSSAEEQVHKHMRQQATKLSTEIRKSFKTTFRTTVDLQDTSSRRIVIQNNTNQLVNYELRRKMRQVAVQVQHIGTQLCWQFYLDNPGKDIGIGQLVHIAKPSDLSSNINLPEAPPPLEPKKEELTVLFELVPLTGFGFTADHLFQDRPKSSSDGPNVIIATNPDTGKEYVPLIDDEGVQIKNFKDYRAPKPPDAAGYSLTYIEIKSVQQLGGEGAPYIGGPEFVISDEGKTGDFKMIIHSINFANSTRIQLTLNLLWEPSKEAHDAQTAAFNAKVKEFEQEKSREAHKQYVELVRERVKLASNVRPRPSSDLRNEERVVVFRRLIQELTGTSSNEDPHVTSELIRSIFDVDQMLYFVAPDWWLPHKRMPAEPSTSSLGGMGRTVPSSSESGVNDATSARFGGLHAADTTNRRLTIAAVTPPPPVLPATVASFNPTRISNPSANVLSRDDIVSWGGAGEKNRDNYLITEDSEPAKMGSSIGWLLQLDGDNHRNAFLNSAWVKAVIPIRAGKEKAAINWLKKNHVEGHEDYDTVKDKIEGLIEELIKMREPSHAKKANNGDGEVGEEASSDVLATDKVFTTGFDPLEGGFRAPGTERGKPFSIFDQWIEILPTDQIVAVEYKPEG